MKNNKKTEVKLSKKKLKMYVGVILSTLRQTMRDCKTYEEFKVYIDSIWKEEEK